MNFNPSRKQLYFVLLTISIFYLKSLSILAQPNSKSIENTIATFTQLVSSRPDSNALNGLIANEGVGIIFSNTDGPPDFVKADADGLIKFITEHPWNFHCDSLPPITRTSSLPVYNVDENAWSQSGIFYNPDFSDHVLIRLGEGLQEYLGAEIFSDDRLAQLRNADQDNFKVVVALKDRGYSFYMKKEKRRWRVAIIDATAGQ